MEETCVCRLCNCPRHHTCPRGEKRSFYETDVLKSSYTNDFVPLDLTKRSHSIVPKREAVALHSDEGQYLSTAKESFTPRLSQTDRRQPFKPDNRSSVGPMQPRWWGATTNKSDYIKLCGKPSQSAKPLGSTLRSGVGFDGMTTNRQDFSGHPLVKRDPIQKPEHALTVPTNSSYGTITTYYQDEFHPHPPGYRKSAKPLRVLKASNYDAADLITTTQSEFYPKSVRQGCITQRLPSRPVDPTTGHVKWRKQSVENLHLGDV